MEVQRSTTCKGYLLLMDLHIDWVKHNTFFIVNVLGEKGGWWEQKVKVELVLVPDLNPAQHEV